ncbi:hypothetical protein U1Q18_045274 [Sarracenia purpurea var. burkii]
MPCKFSDQHLRPTAAAVFFPVTPVVEILRVANRVVLKRRRLGSINAPPFSHQHLYEPPPHPSSAYVVPNRKRNAGVFLVNGNARRRHATGKVRRPPKAGERSVGATHIVEVFSEVLMIFSAGTMRKASGRVWILRE